MSMSSHTADEGPSQAVAGSPLLQARGLKKSFSRDRAEFVAVDDVTLSVARGSFQTIVGPSGCGKSTLLQMFAGLLTPTAGEVTFAGEKVTAPPFEMIYLFQQYTKSLMPWRTVLENVMFGMEVARRREGLTANDVRQRCLDQLERVGLAGSENQYPSQLSGGMQQRVAIARALVCEPAVLLMDEPFSALDALSRGSLQDLVLELWEQLDLTVLFVTHDIEEAVYLSDSVAVLSKSPSRIINHYTIDLPRPREQVTTRESAAFLEYRRDLYEKVLSQ